MPAVGFDPTSSPLWADNHLPVGHVKVKFIFTGQGGRRRCFRRSSAELHRHYGAVFIVQLDFPPTPSSCRVVAASVKLPNCNEYRRYVSIVWPRSYEPRALPLRHPGDKLPQCLDAPLRCEDEYRQPVSIEWPRSYEPRALTSAPCRWRLRLTSSLTSGNYVKAQRPEPHPHVVRGFEGGACRPLMRFCKAAELECIPPVSFDLTSSGW